jgi:hypothetical protein
MEQGKIYGLFDPRTNVCRYVGQTVQPLSHRLCQHLRTSGNSSREKWIAELDKHGYEPTIRLLQEVEYQELTQAEGWWINHLRSFGVPLTNDASVRWQRDELPMVMGFSAPISPHAEPTSQPPQVFSEEERKDIMRLFKQGWLTATGNDRREILQMINEDLNRSAWNCFGEAMLGRI